MTTKLEPIALLGLGIMGSSMAVNFAKAGCTISAWNRTKGRPAETAVINAGGRIAGSIKEAVANAKIIFICLPDVPDVRELLFNDGGVMDSALPGSFVVDTSTTGPGFAKEVYDELKRSGMRFLDAPFSGGDVGGRDGTLTFMVGGDQSDFEVCKPYFEIIGKLAFWCGPSGSGQAVKLCNQVLCAVNMMAVCEAMQLADALGVPKQLMIDICKTGAGGSWALSNLAPRLVQGDLSPGFVLDHMLNNLRLVHESTDIGNSRMVATELAVRLFKEVQGLELGKVGTQAMIRAYPCSNRN